MHENEEKIKNKNKKELFYLAKASELSVTREKRSNEGVVGKGGGNIAE